MTLINTSVKAGTGSCEGDSLQAAIEVRGLRKTYGPVVAVDDVSFDVTAGEIFGVLGANGAGKTTAVECVQGLRRADRGHIRVLGRDPSDRRRLASHVGSQLQSSALPDRIRVQEAVDLFAIPGAVDSFELLEAWGLAEHRKAAFGDLSGGLRQRVFIALALVNRPTVVFFDELTQGLDPLARHDVWEAIDTVRQRGTTVVMVTHFMDEAEALCDRLAIFDQGRIVATGTPDEIIASEPTTATVSFSWPETQTGRLERCPGVESIHSHGGHTSVIGQPSMVGYVCAALIEAGPPPPDLRITLPTLEDAVVAIEGARR